MRIIKKNHTDAAVYRKTGLGACVTVLLYFLGEEADEMLCQETGVLSGSEYFLKPVTDAAEQLLFYQVSCGHYHCGKGYEVRRTNLPAVLIMSIQQGSLTVHSEEEQCEARAGDTVLLDCTRPHRYYTDSYVEFYWMHTSGSNSFSLCRYLNEQNKSMLHHTAQMPEIAEIMYHLISAYRSRKPMRESEEAIAIYRLYCSLMPDMRKNPQGQVVRDVMQRLHIYIEAHLAEELRLEDLAAHVGLSESYLIRLFHKREGMTPYEYVIRVRMDYARYLLKNTQLSILEIAKSVGYRSQQGFINAFAQHIGMSPGRYRRAPLE